MTFVEIIETSGEARPRRRYYQAVLALIFVLIALATAVRFSGRQSSLVDFQDFYVVGWLVSAGRIVDAYSLMKLLGAQRAMFGEIGLMPWTYPPQFDLLVWALAKLPIWLAYGLFITPTFVAYFFTISRLAPGRLATVLMLIAPAAVLTIRCGQNGFLSGALIGLSAIGLIERRSWAGVPLGLMIIKPHLAIAFALHTLLSRRWNVVLIAGCVVVLTSALATAALGLAVWPAFLHGIQEASGFLIRGLYPQYRMVSGYALARSLGFSALAGSATQTMFAAVAVLATCLAVIRFNPRQAVGIAAIASVMISPYAYDYDLPVFGVGFAILLDDLVRYGSLRERFALYIFVIGVQLIAFALAVEADFADSKGPMPVSLGCFGVAATLVTMWRILERSRASADSLSSALPAGAPAH